jgi:hypothetical protein
MTSSIKKPRILGCENPRLGCSVAAKWLCCRVLVLESLTAVDNDGFNFTVAEIDLDLQRSKEEGMILLDFFDIRL